MPVCRYGAILVGWHEKIQTQTTELSDLTANKTATCRRIVIMVLITFVCRAQRKTIACNRRQWSVDARANDERRYNQQIIAINQILCVHNTNSMYFGCKKFERKFCVGSWSHRKEKIIFIRFRKINNCDANVSHCPFLCEKAAWRATVNFATL